MTICVVQPALPAHAGYTLQPGQTCRVYTNESHPDTCGFSFGSGKAIWNNKGDCGHLYRKDGSEANTYCY
jgi:hypothetical protein